MYTTKNNSKLLQYTTRTHPRQHDGRIVDTPHQDVLNSPGSQRVLLCDIIGNLFCGSGGGKRTGQSQQDHLFVGTKVGDIHHFGRKALMQFDSGRNLVADRNGKTSCCCCCCCACEVRWKSAGGTSPGRAGHSSR